MPLYNIEDPKKPASLSHDDVSFWSDYADTNYKPGMSFSDLWAKFKKDNPSAKIDKDTLLNDLNKLQQYVTEDAKRRGLDASLTAGSGAMNTGFSFPKVSFNGKDYGRMNAAGKTLVQPAVQDNYPVPKSMVQAHLPDDVNPDDIWVEDGIPKWLDPNTKDVVIGDKSILGSTNFRKKVKK